MGRFQLPLSPWAWGLGQTPPAPPHLRVSRVTPSAPKGSMRDSLGVQPLSSPLPCKSALPVVRTHWGPQELGLGLTHLMSQW